MRQSMILRMAARDLLRQRRRAALAVLITIFAVSSVLFTRAWQNGMLALMEREGASTWLGAVQVRPSNTLHARNANVLEPNLEVSSELRDRIESIPGVVVSPRIRFFGQLFKGDASAPFIGLGTERHTAVRAVPNLFDEARLEEGRPLSPDRDDEVLVAAPLARALGIRPGDTATLLVRPVDGGLEGADVRVVGLLRAALEENHRRAVIADLGLVQRMLRMEDRATELILGVDPTSRAHAVAEAIPPRVAGIADVEAHAWDRVNTRYQDAREIWSAALGVILLVAGLVAALGLFTTLALVVHERGREIATLAALGLRRRGIAWLFFVEGGVVGALGGAAGAAIAGLLAAWLSVDGVPFTVPEGMTVYVRPSVAISDMALGVLVVTAMAAATCASVAVRAARRSPAAALRG